MVSLLISCQDENYPEESAVLPQICLWHFFIGSMGKPLEHLTL
jgi:hypothetical protein